MQVSVDPLELVLPLDVAPEAPEEPLPEEPVPEDPVPEEPELLLPPPLVLEQPKSVRVTVSAPNPTVFQFMPPRRSAAAVVAKISRSLYSRPSRSTRKRLTSSWLRHRRVRLRSSALSTRSWARSAACVSSTSFSRDVAIQRATVERCTS